MKTNITIEEKMFEVFKEASEKTHGLVEIAGQNYINENIVKQALLDHEQAVKGEIRKKIDNLWVHKVGGMAETMNGDMLSKKDVLEALNNK